MKCYTNCADAIIDLHQDGFTHDFQLFGNDLLCVQGGFFIRTGEFAIVEYYKITGSNIDDTGESIVFGIIAPYHHIKGILLNHYKSYLTVTPPVLLKKLNEFNVRRLDAYIHNRKKII